MTLKFKNPQPIQKQPDIDKLLQTVQVYQPIQGHIPGLNIGIPIGGVPTPGYVIPKRQRIPQPPIPIPGQDLPHALNYYADYGGCGFWRMSWPEHFLNAYQKAVVNGLSTMILEPRMYGNIKAVKLQRQATPTQLEFVKFLKMASKEFGFKIIYEIDDIVFKEDIPDYNRCKDAFVDPTIVQSILAMMRLVDEISVTCDYMRDYYINKTGNTNVTVIPNYPPRSWIDRFYNETKLCRNFENNISQPRVAWLVSGTHFDIANRTNQFDDSSHITDQIIKTRKKYKWVFVGGHPLRVKPFIENGEMEFHGWSVLYDYPRAVNALNINAVIAPLADNVFNRSKSEIKYLEAAAFGLPGVFQDLVTYKNAPLRFTTGDEMIDQLGVALNDWETYQKYSKLARAYVETMWLEDHLDEHYELYFTPPEQRKALLKNNK